MKKLLGLLLLSTQAFAAGQGKGGGDVVVCYDENNNIKRMEGYDFWNASQQYNLEIIKDHKHNYMDIVKETLRKLNELDPMLAKTLSEDVQIFAPEIIARDDNEMIGLVPRIKSNGDGKQTIFPADKDEDCTKQTVERIAEFSAKPLPFEKQFRLKKDLWEAADDLTKAAIVQHEVIYKHFKTFAREEDSRKAQLYNAYISSKEFLEADGISYFEFVKNLRLQNYEGFSAKIHGLPFVINRSFFDTRDGNQYITGDLIEPTKIVYQDKQIEVDFLIMYLDGSLKSFDLTTPEEILINGQNITVKKVELYKEGSPNQVKLEGEQNFEIYGENYIVSQTMYFAPNGNVKRIYAKICNTRYTQTLNGRERTKNGAYSISFNTDARRIEDISFWVSRHCSTN